MSALRRGPRAPCVLRAVAAVACVAVLLPAGAGPADPMVRGAVPPPPFTEVAATPATLDLLRAGGYVLYLRHGTTDNTRPDRVPNVDLDDCATQRPLNAAGRQMAADVGTAMRTARIPVGEIRISPLCRVKETAAAAFPGSAVVVDVDLMYTANLTSEQKGPILRNTRQHLSRAVPAGANRVVVAHAPNLMDLLGYFPKEGTLVVFRPRGGGAFEYVASVAPAQWPALLR